jgi:hypothetical protein
MQGVNNHSYSRFGGPGLTNREKYIKACQSRSREFGNILSSHIDVEISPDQQREILKACPRSLTIGAMMGGALDINLGKGLAQRKFNLIGELEGMACIANSAARIKRLRQAATLETAQEALKLARKNERASKKGAKIAQAARKKAEQEEISPILELLQQAGHIPEDATKLLVAPMKAYLKDNDITKEMLPKVPKVFNRPSLVVFFSALCRQRSSKGGASMSVHELVQRATDAFMEAHGDGDGGGW